MAGDLGMHHPWMPSNSRAAHTRVSCMPLFSKTQQLCMQLFCAAAHRTSFTCASAEAGLATHQCSLHVQSSARCILSAMPFRTSTSSVSFSLCRNHLGTHK